MCGQRIKLIHTIYKIFHSYSAVNGQNWFQFSYLNTFVWNFHSNLFLYQSNKNCTLYVGNKNRNKNLFLCLANRKKLANWRWPLWQYPWRLSEVNKNALHASLYYCILSNWYRCTAVLHTRMRADKHCHSWHFKCFVEWKQIQILFSNEMDICSKFPMCTIYFRWFWQISFPNWISTRSFFCLTQSWKLN